MAAFRRGSRQVVLGAMSGWRVTPCTQHLAGRTFLRAATVTARPSRLRFLRRRSVYLRQEKEQRRHSHHITAACQCLLWH
ncbi:hypothetical protein E2C01_044236 [Portunus trituberculatus]|uniref:Uncharacterized protein n=1 Tax=Portunus trituberculatus TaxID=210409 RepID=A0A5B7FZV8_PORTR|nr:hypothetical protein [Portunus trituberculatus]